ncbi:DUF523 and DUF1722 domain-containing protein [Dasania sp. GY-MA-18]|uniref:DUF523 and DUF1722 domain-containing protein n=2 Tax=Dasania phycosphaerae TaxID=2950436 RepID=A0A9J6RHJ0_9GAMM|nr:MULTISPECIES: DUF523 and DUF1722 domain-containing protein [Dasania]MCR8921308.1 DUF523 and DUF1722 domain-containing protein [Dasania sp. GY-MA-18]MCZ0863736.1 DUF523 and DUF1722 domain-containing protein [Dasania phycosphaerae]MCZ0867464.1 DUF523 and DUF1722 domain-containing protein [Dasania phycosphaerae]
MSDISTTIQVGLSACLAGQEVRYNGGHSQSKLCLHTLAQYFEFKTFCPEVAAGFGTPRPTMRLTGDPANPRLQFSDDSQQDLTQQLNQGFSDKLAQFKDFDGYILMKNSPSCGLERIKIYQANGYPHKQRGQGLFTAALIKRYPLLPVEEEGRLHDPHLKENFILRVYAHHYFKQEVLSAPDHHALIQFHSRYKYILMAHNQELYRELGRILSNAQESEINALSQQYLKLFMQALSKPASHKNHSNTLLHILGYLKKTVPSEARQNIAEVIHKYRQNQLPLSTPITLLKHYIEQYGTDYIKSQRYFEPYPEALCLANHL